MLLRDERNSWRRDICGWRVQIERQDCPVQGLPQQHHRHLRAKQGEVRWKHARISANEDWVERHIHVLRGNQLKCRDSSKWKQHQHSCILSVR